MQVINYYKLSDEELDFKINQIREWSIENDKDERIGVALFALRVSLNARELRQEGIDDFIALVIDHIT